MGKKSVKIKIKDAKRNADPRSVIAEKAYHAANLIVNSGELAEASKMYIELRDRDSEMGDFFWERIETFLTEISGHVTMGSILFKMFRRRVNEDVAMGAYSNSVMAEENIKAEEKEPTTQDLFEKMIKAGPLSAEEAKRRGDITLYNHIYDLFVSSVKDAKNFDEGNLWVHPETIQIIGYYGLALLELGSTIGNRVGVRHIP